MRGADVVNDEFEVGFNERFELGWRRAEQVGRVVMVAFVVCAIVGLLGRGPYSHRTIHSTDGSLGADYEPVSRRSVDTMITVHVPNPGAAERAVRIGIDQHFIEPMGFQGAVPRPNSTGVSSKGISLDFQVQGHQQDALIRFKLMPNVIGWVPVSVGDGHQTLQWQMFVVP